MRQIRTAAEAQSLLHEAMSAAKDIVPYLPQVLLRVQKAIARDNIGARELAQVILADPSLTARVLRLANSAFYSHQHQKIKTVTSAIVLLGFEPVRNLVLGLTVYDMLSSLPRALDYKQVWRHSLCCAVTAQHFARQVSYPVPEQAFVVGMLHDIGKLVLGQFFPEHYCAAVNLSRMDRISQVAAERQVMQITHLEAGKYIAEHWGFPTELAEAIERHELVENGRGLNTEPPLVKLVAVSNAVTHYLYGEDPSHRLSTAQIQDLCANVLGINIKGLIAVFEGIKEQVFDVGRILDIAIDEWKLGTEERPSSTSLTPVSATEPKKNEAARVEFLLACSEEAAECGAVAVFLHYTAEKLCDTLELKTVLYLVRNHATEVLEASFAYGIGAKELKDQISIHLQADDELAARAWLHRAAIAIVPETVGEYNREGACNLLTLLKTPNLGALAVCGKSSTAGVLVVARPKDMAPLDQEDLRILSVYCRSIMAVHIKSSLPPAE